MPLKNNPAIEAKLNDAAELIKMMDPLLDAMRTSKDENYESARSRYACLSRAAAIVETVGGVYNPGSPSNLIEEVTMRRAVQMLDNDYKICMQAFEQYGEKYKDLPDNSPKRQKYV